MVETNVPRQSVMLGFTMVGGDVAKVNNGVFWSNIL
jgi:hypothetical protein